jgi:murein DD-endopeptidase MepM/ murein hydrolase activator NlpD
MIRNGKAWLVGILVLAALGLVLRPLFSRDSARAPSTAAAMAPPRAVVFDTLGRGESLAELMSANGLDGAQIHEITRLVRDWKLPRTLLPGVVLRLSGPTGEKPDRLDLKLNPDSSLRFVSSDSAWSARLVVQPVVVDTVRLSGVIESSLWLARLGGDVDRLAPGGFEELVYDLADVYAWKVDFTRDIRRGDSFRVAIEREVRPDGSVRSRRFLAIELRNDGKVLRAFPYAGDRGRVAFYDDEGRPLRGAFLRYPVPYRITSGFTRHRYHPVLKIYRPHQGIDYGAPTGTRVHATGSGTVTRAGWAGSYGRLVEIRHRAGIRTRYAHLSAIAPGIRPGRHVEQGQWIGRVGSSGLATGPHLHYEFLQGGVHRNPLAVSVPAEPPLAKAHMADFLARSHAALALLDGVAAPPVSREAPLATAER